MKNEIVPIFFTIDDSYAPLLCVALRSLIDNADRSRKYKITVLHSELSAENLGNIRAMACEGFEIDTKEMAASLEGIEDREGNRLRCDYFTATIYYRLFLSEMYPEYDKAIYIDSDVVVPGNIAEMYDIDLGDKLVAACPDYSIQEIPELMSYVTKAIGVGSGIEYMNSGILLMNLREMRRLNFLKHFLSVLNKYQFKSVAPDQDYLNAICMKRKMYLDEKWDAMPNPNNEPMADPSIIHYNLFQKPWMYDDIQYADYFWHYAEKTPYAQYLRDYKASYSDEQKKHDAESLGLLVRTAAILADEELTFNNISQKQGGIAL